MAAFTPEQHIVNLLYDHNCVIVPQLGGFVTNYASARVDLMLNHFSPPSKSISFNRHLVHNDGLLAAYVSEHTGIPYDEAVEQIQRWVGETLFHIKSGKSITLRHIGALYTDSNGILRFEPDLTINFNRDSFGLTDFFMPRVNGSVTSAPVPAVADSREEKETDTEKDLAPEAVIIPIQRTATWTKLARYAAIALTAPALGYAIWFSFHFKELRNSSFSTASLNPFAEKVCNAYQVRSVELPDWTPEPVHSDLTLDENAGYAVLSLWEADERAGLIVKMNDHPAVPVTTFVASAFVPPSNASYHVIGGCFSVFENAENLVDQLKALGYQAFILDRHKGLFRVSYGGFLHRAEADRALADARNRHNSNAWILAL